MLTGRAFCGACGGTLAAAGRDYLACTNARKFGTCRERKGIRRAVLEGHVLELVRDRLMKPEAVRAFLTSYHQEINAGHDASAAERRRREKEPAARRNKLEGMYDAVAEGLRTPGLLAKMEALEKEVAALEAVLAALGHQVRPVPANIDELYQVKVGDLATSLADPLIRDEAIVHLRALTDRVEVAGAGDGQRVTVFGALPGMGPTGYTEDGSLSASTQQCEPPRNETTHENDGKEAVTLGGWCFAAERRPSGGPLRRWRSHWSSHSIGAPSILARPRTTVRFTLSSSSTGGSARDAHARLQKMAASARA
jgi:hypothetical protein